MRQRIIGFCKSLYRIADMVVYMLGFVILVILVAYSIAYAKGFPVSNPKILLDPFMAPTLVWIWIGSFIVILVSFPVKIYLGIKKGLSQVGGSDLNTEQKVKKVLSWIVKN